MTTAGGTSSGGSDPRRLVILGSTGSIGAATLDVVRHLGASGGRSIEVVGLAAGRRSETLREQADAFGVTAVAIADAREIGPLDGLDAVHAGPDAALELVRSTVRQGDLVVAAMVGAAGIPATLAAIERGADIALANKETLVAAGSLVLPAMRRAGSRLLPVDSEHSAILQCLLSGRWGDEVARCVLTASGGPFRTWPASAMADATVDQALAHPTWRMGPKVTIDSATMMNKALEVIEAHWLFDLEVERIDVLVHPQSIVHGMVEFVDGSTIAQLGRPDMRVPIQLALTWPARVEGSTPAVDLASIGSLEFEPADHDRFPALDLARRAIREGGSAAAVMNAANEIAVEAFIAHRVRFGAIVDLVADAMDSIAPRPVADLAELERVDAAAREHVRSRIAGREGSIAALG